MNTWPARASIRSTGNSKPLLIEQYNDHIQPNYKARPYPGGPLAELFGRIWAFWALIVFVTTMIIFLIPFLLFCYFLPDPLKTNRFIRFARVWMNVFLHLVGCPLSICGKEFFQPGKTYIVVCNHNSLMDVPVSSPGIPGGNKTIAKAEMARIPVFNLLYKTGSVLVDRKSDASRRESFIRMREVLDMGLHMCIYPEGTRNKTDQPLKSFHDGAFRLATSSGQEIIPAVIFNSRRALPASKSFFLWPQKLSMHFLPPVAPGQDIGALKQTIYRQMESYYRENAERLA